MHHHYSMRYKYFKLNIFLKFRSNALGTQFTLYDNGENPKKSWVIGDSVRQELAAVIYVRMFDFALNFNNLKILPKFAYFIRNNSK